MRQINMDLKEYLQIMRKNANVFLAIVAAAVAGSFLFVAQKPVAYSTSLALNITRSGAQQTTGYKYDDFYRLQADEKFAETVVKWLRDPRTVTDIYDLAGLDASTSSIRQLSKSFTPEKLSSQFISVSFSARSSDSAKKISAAVTEIVSQKTALLDKEQNESTWFKVVVQEPVIVLDEVDPFLLFTVSLAVGIFLAFWTVLVIHYLK